MKKKLITGLALAMTLGLSALPVSAATEASTLAYPAQQVAAYDEETAVENFVAAQEARKTYLEELLNGGLISQEAYDLNIANIDANIEYVQENGLGVPYGGGYGGYGYGGCCGGFGGYGMGMRGYGMGW